MLYTLNIYSTDVNKTEQRELKILNIFRSDSIWYFSFATIEDKNHLNTIQ